MWRSVLSLFVMLLVINVSHAHSIDEQALRLAMEDTLRDADSAKFRKLRAGPDPATPGAVILCGEVNAKNMHGAYVGYTPFLAVALSKGGYYVVGVSQDSGVLCKQKGI